MSYVQLPLFDTSFYVSQVRRTERVRSLSRRGINLGYLSAPELESLLLKNDTNSVQVVQQLEFSLF